MPSSPPAAWSAGSRPGTKSPLPLGEGRGPPRSGGKGEGEQLIQSPSPFRAFGAPSLSHRERENTGIPRPSPPLSAPCPPPRSFVSSTSRPPATRRPRTPCARSGGRMSRFRRAGGGSCSARGARPWSIPRGRCRRSPRRSTTSARRMSPRRRCGAMSRARSSIPIRAGWRSRRIARASSNCSARRR